MRAKCFWGGRRCELAAGHRFGHRGEGLGPEEHRGEQLMLRCNRDVGAHEMHDGGGVDDEASRGDAG